MKLRRIKAVYKKQFFDKTSLRSMLFQSLIYPLMAIMFSISGDESEKLLMVSTLTPMFVGSSPMLTVNNLVREDKNGGSLRALMLASVRPLEYITAVALFMLTVSGITALLMGLAGGIGGIEILYFFAASMLGCLLTVLLACAVSFRNNNSANSIMLINVLSLANGFIPLIGIYYPSATAVTKYWYTQQVKDIMFSIFTGETQDLALSFGVMIATLLVFLALFIISFRKNRIFSQE